MKKKYIYKIGFPHWLKELIEKGKYDDISHTSPRKAAFYKLIHRRRIDNKKLKPGISTVCNKKLPKTISKPINNSQYTFDTARRLITIERQDD